ERCHQHLVAGSLLDHLVKLVVGAAPGRDLLVRQPAPAVARAARDAPQSLAKLRLRPLQPLELLLPDPQRRDLRRERLELGAHLVRVADLAGCEAADERAAVRAELDEAARLQLAQRLAERRPADPELLR